MCFPLFPPIDEAIMSLAALPANQKNDMVVSLAALLLEDGGEIPLTSFTSYDVLAYELLRCIRYVASLSRRTTLVLSMPVLVFLVYSQQHMLLLLYPGCVYLV